MACCDRSVFEIYHPSDLSFSGIILPVFKQKITCTSQSGNQPPIWKVHTRFLLHLPHRSNVDILLFDAQLLLYSSHLIYKHLSDLSNLSVLQCTDSNIGLFYGS